MLYTNLLKWKELTGINQIKTEIKKFTLLLRKIRKSYILRYNAK